MKRTSVILGFITVVAILLGSQAYAEPTHIPHEDPDKVEDFIDNPALLLYYADILTKIGQGDYDKAVKMINDLQYAHIPEDQRELLDKYAGLINELPNVVIASRTALNDASLLFSQYRLDETGAKLEEVQTIIDDMETLLAGIETDMETVGENFGVFQSLPTSLLFQAWQTLQDSFFDMIEKTKAEAIAMKALLDAELAEIYAKNLRPTTLTLSISPTTAYLGESITASGTLSAGKLNLNRKKITVLLNGINVSEVITDSKGKFHIAVCLPYNYITNMTVMAQYTPSGKDLDKYLPATSAAENITAQFYNTQIVFDAPSEGYPGLPIDIKGQISSEQTDDSAVRNVQIYMDDELVDELSTADGIFATQYTIGTDTVPGDHSIGAIVSSYGLYDEASCEDNINISRAPLSIDAKTPTFVILPDNINITGNISSQLPISSGTVRIEFGGETVETSIQDNGQFNTNLSMGFNEELSGSHDLIITVYPNEPWNETSEIRITIFTLNVVNVAVLSFCIAMVSVAGITTYNRKKHYLLTRDVRHAPETLKSQEPSLKASSKKQVVIMEGNKAQLLDTYIKTVHAIEKKILVHMEPDMTMREFLSAAKPRLYNLDENFTRLTQIAEKALYSQHETLSSEIIEAEKLAATIMEVL